MKQEAFSYNGIYCCNGQEEIQQMVVWAIRISSIGYIFMGLSIGVQGVVQALGYALKPLIISLLRLVVLVLPLVWLFCLSSNASMLVWIAFPIAKLITALISVIYVYKAYKKKIKGMFI